MIEDRLGGGPHADVYKAQHVLGGPQLAIKVLRPQSAESPATLKLFQREARIGMSLRHRHLVSILDAFTSASPCYLVMEYLTGQSAKRRVQEHGRLPLVTALAVGRQIAEALAALHAEGFIHGDVKSDNVRLVRPGRAVLVDLGFAHSPGELLAWAERGRMMGTPNYLAPELCWRPPNDTYAADIFSFGVMLYELLTGELPYPRGSVKDVIRRRRSDGAVELQLSPGEWPQDLVRLIQRATMPEPRDRPRAKQLVTSLTALQILAMRRKAG